MPGTGRGRVVLQSHGFTPDHPAIRASVSNVANQTARLAVPMLVRVQREQRLRMTPSKNMLSTPYRDWALHPATSANSNPPTNRR
jgi:hypothetical protein